MPRWNEYDWDQMVRRKAPAPLVAAALLLSYWVATAESGSITAVKCKADHGEMLDALEDIRESAVSQINAQIAQTNDPQRVEALTAMRERAWDEEEAHRGRAQQTYFDCLNAARPGN